MTTVAPAIERKVTLLDSRALTKHTAEPGEFEGLASKFGVVDLQRDIVVRGAFRETLEEFKRSGAVLWGHDTGAFPVATPETIEERTDGLYLTGIFHTDRRSQDARRIVKERGQRGKSVGLSIGFTPEDFEYRDDGIRLLKQVRLWEISLVLMPANQQALVASSKSGQPGRVGHHEARQAWLEGQIVLARTAGLIGVPLPAHRDRKSSGSASAQDVIRDAEMLLIRFDPEHRPR